MTNRTEHIRQIITELSEFHTHIRLTWQAQMLTIHPELTRGALPVLLAIIRQAPITATELSCQMGLDKTMVSKIVALLRGLNLVSTEVSTEDRRVTLLSGTPFAAERLEEVREHIAEDYRARFEGWSDEEVAAFVDAVHRFNLAGRESTTQGD